MKENHYKYLIAIIYTCVLFLDRLDLTIVNITLPTVAKYFHVPITATDWITISFLLALAISIPISSWLGERFGLKIIYISAMFLFGLGATLCLFSSSLHSLIVYRWIQGIGGGLLIPVGMTMIYRAYDSSEYASITSFTFLPSLIAPAIAPFIGGVILDAIGWRYVFILSGPIALLLAFVSVFFLKTEGENRILTPFDGVGFVLCSFFLMDLFLFLSKIGEYGLNHITLMELILSIIFFIAFVKRERSFLYPLINLNYFKQGNFLRANLIQLCFQSCHFGAIFLIGMYLQVGLNLSAIMAGLIMGMQAVGAMTTSRYSVRLFNLYGAKLPIILGLTGVAVLSPSILFLQGGNLVLFGLILFFMRGVFSGLCGTPIQTLSVIDCAKENISQINSIFNTCRQVAISLGVAISSILISIGIKLNHVRNNDIVNHIQAVKVFGLGFIAIMLLAMLGIYIAKEIEQL